MNPESLREYPDSARKHGDSEFRMAGTGSGGALIVSGPDMALFDGTEETLTGKTRKICPLTVENSKVIRKLFDFTNPKSHKGRDVTIGLGDRLGLASAGHIRLIRDLDVFPVLAQQSIRELYLTGRTYDDVLAAAVWAVFREGYTKGYGADGDHLKTHEEVKYALDCGYSMITLDCSEHIRNDIAGASRPEIDAQYAQLPASVIADLESVYLNNIFHIDGDITVEFDEHEFRRMALVYLPVIDHTLSIYSELIKNAGVDFEVSIDETLATTSPQSHFFVANELVKRGVEIASLAPRFAGEFQKGIDYRGDPSEFERDFLIHAKIAEKFGYKISVHSGSDKFSIFPIVNRLTGGRYHLKTAGTNWLEAVRVIARRAPPLYRRIHLFAMENLPEAKQYYHTTENVVNITDINSVSDAELPEYLEQDDARQVLHITYGLILQARANDGSPLLRDMIYETLNAHESDYFAALEKHIGRHLSALGIEMVTVQGPPPNGA